MKYLFLLALTFAMALPSQAQDLPVKSIDERIVPLLNNFMNALLIADSDASAQECLKYVHVSLMNASKSDLTQDLRMYSFKKAHDNAKFYSVPVVITRVRKSKVTGIGFGETAQLGTTLSIFISKKPGVNGMPAPIEVFLPADGSEPKISYMGSL